MLLERNGKFTMWKSKSSRLSYSLVVLYAQGMRSFEQYDEICKYFAEGKQRDNDANEIQKHLKLYNLRFGEYLVNKYALWLDFRTIDENELHGMGRRIENALKGITLQIEKKKNQLGLSMLTFT